MNQKTYNEGWNAVAIRDFLVGNYTLEQLHSLSRKLAGNKWYEIAGDNKPDYARNLIFYCSNRGLYSELLQALQQSPDNPSDGTVTRLQHFYGDAQNIQEVYAFLAQYDKLLLSKVASRARLEPEDIEGISTRAYAENLVDACARRGIDWYSRLIQVMQS